MSGCGCGTSGVRGLRGLSDKKSNDFPFGLFRNAYGVYQTIGGDRWDKAIDTLHDRVEYNAGCYNISCYFRSNIEKTVAAYLHLLAEKKYSCYSPSTAKKVEDEVINATGYNSAKEVLYNLYYAVKDGSITEPSLICPTSFSDPNRGSDPNAGQNGSNPNNNGAPKEEDNTAAIVLGVGAVGILAYFIFKK